MSRSHPARRCRGRGCRWLPGWGTLWRGWGWGVAGRPDCGRALLDAGGDAVRGEDAPVDRPDAAVVVELPSALELHLVEVDGRQVAEAVGDAAVVRARRGDHGE